MQSIKDPVIREAKRSDSEVLAKLSCELGYPATTAEMEERFDKLSSNPDNGIFVAEIDEVVGWIHVAVIISLESNTYAEIIGLVIDEKYRGSGIGTRLVARAEKWGSERNISRIRVRTNILRNETKKFYKKLGFKTAKTQEVFDKDIDAL